MMENRQDIHAGLAVDLAKEALKGLLLVNGGAATALLALASHGENVQKFGQSILLFGLGALVTVIAMFVGYFSQLSFANDHHKSHLTLQVIAILLVVTSVTFSGFGFWTAFSSLA